MTTGERTITGVEATNNGVPSVAQNLPDWLANYPKKDRYVRTDIGDITGMSLTGKPGMLVASALREEGVILKKGVQVDFDEETYLRAAIRVGRHQPRRQVVNSGDGGKLIDNNNGNSNSDIGSGSEDQKQEENDQVLLWLNPNNNEQNGQDIVHSNPDVIPAGSVDTELVVEPRLPEEFPEWLEQYRRENSDLVAFRVGNLVDVTGKKESTLSSEGYGSVWIGEGGSVKRGRGGGASPVDWETFARIAVKIGRNRSLYPEDYDTKKPVAVEDQTRALGSELGQVVKDSVVEPMEYRPIRFIHPSQRPQRQVGVSIPPRYDGGGKSSYDWLTPRKGLVVEVADSVARIGEREALAAVKSLRSLADSGKLARLGINLSVDDLQKLDAQVEKYQALYRRDETISYFSTLFGRLVQNYFGRQKEFLDANSGHEVFWVFSGYIGKLEPSVAKMVVNEMR